MATRAASGAVLDVLASRIPYLIGGSADLSGSNKTKFKGAQGLSRDDFNGRYIYYGVREHGMSSILSGMALHGGLRPYGGTFLVFSDYLRPTIRLASMMSLLLIPSSVCALSRALQIPFIKTSKPIPRPV